MKYEQLKWEWDKYGSESYNALGRFETTLINLGILKDYADIDASEEFDMKYGLKINRTRDGYECKFIQPHNDSDYLFGELKEPNGDHDRADRNS